MGVRSDVRRRLHLACSQAVLIVTGHMLVEGAVLPGVQLSTCPWLPVSHTRMDGHLPSSVMVRVCVQASSLQGAFHP